MDNGRCRRSRARRCRRAPGGWRSARCRRAPAPDGCRAARSSSRNRSRLDGCFIVGAPCLAIALSRPVPSPSGTGCGRARDGAGHGAGRVPRRRRTRARSRAFAALALSPVRGWQARERLPRVRARIPSGSGGRDRKGGPKALPFTFRKALSSGRRLAHLCVRPNARAQPLSAFRQGARGTVSRTDPQRTGDRRRAAGAARPGAWRARMAAVAGRRPAVAADLRVRSGALRREHAARRHPARRLRRADLDLLHLRADPRRPDASRLQRALAAGVRHARWRGGSARCASSRSSW